MTAALFYENSDGSHGISNNCMAMVSQEYKFAGELMAMSLIHGGPAPNIMEEWLYDFMISETIPKALPANNSWQELLDKARLACTVKGGCFAVQAHYAHIITILYSQGC